MPLRRFSVPVLLAVGAVALFARRTEDEPAALLAQGRDFLASGKPAAAAEVLGRVGGDVVKDEFRKEAAVLGVLALVQDKKPTEAAKAAGDLLAAWPADEPWRGRVEGLIVAAALQRGDVKAAVEREAALARRALADEERVRLAASYLAWAERFGKGEPAPDAVRPAIPPDHARAIDAYRRALDVLGDKADVARYRIACARHALALGDGAQAAQWAAQALTAWKPPAPNSAGTKPAVAPAWVAEAHLVRAEGQLAAGDPTSARATLRTLLALPSVEESGFAPDAWLLLGRSYMGDATTGALAQALDAFATHRKRWPDAAAGAKVRRFAVEACLAVGAHERALEALAEMVAAAGAADDKAWARMRRAESLRALRRYDDAKAALLEFLALHPSHADVPAAQRTLPDLVLDRAKDALQAKRQDEALTAYAEFVTTYPLDARAPQISLEIGHELRRAGRHTAARDAYRDARERWRAARADTAAHAGVFVGVVEEEDLRDLEAAALAYKAVVEGFGANAAGGEAARRLSNLESVELSLSAARAFGPHESATVRLRVRNVKETTLRLYRLDAAGYFERKGTLNGAESLDVALVKADRQWRHATPEFARYRADQLDVAVRLGDAPLPEGAYLVSAEAERRRATVVLLVSKVRVVVKRAPTEVFAWTVDAATGAPLRDVEVLVRGTGLKASAKTAEDGSVRLPVKPEHGAVEVLARLGASAVPGMAQPPVAGTVEALSPRAHWTFDRPVYRPGDEVRFAVIVRDVADGAFATPDGEPLALAWLDPRGRLVAEAALKTGAFGEADGVFRLPADGALGAWTLRATLRRETPGVRVYEQRVEVREYRKPELKVSVRAAEANVRPGAKVEVALAVEAYFGGAPQRVDYQWRVFRRRATFDATRYREQAWLYRATEKTAAPTPDASWQYVTQGAGATDEKGAAAFSFETLDLVEPQQYMVQATVVDAAKQPTTGVGTAFAAWTPGNVVVLPDRRAYRAGDRLTARVVGVDWSGAPLALKGRVEALLVRQEGGRTIEEPVAAATVDLGLSGETEARLELGRAGRVVVRFTGEDARGLKTVGESAADVAGERPDLAKEAKIVFERETYRAGEKARLFVDVPAAPATGLLTFEAESVLTHRVVRLTEKSSTLELELPELLAPNCVATWSSFADDRLLTSEDPLVVLRHLDVTVTPSVDVARPGDKIKLAVVARDQAGKPARALASVALFDGALEGLGGVGVQDPRFTFNRDVRTHRVRTGSSCAFAQAAVARALDADLVALDEQAERARTAGRFEDDARRSVELRKAVAKAPGAPPTGGGGGAGPGGNTGGGFTPGAGGGGAGPGRPRGEAAPTAFRRVASAEKAKSAEHERDLEDLAEELKDQAFDADTNGALSFASRTTTLSGTGYGLSSVEPTVLTVTTGGLSERAYKLADFYGFAAGRDAALEFTPAPVELREDLRDVAHWAPRVLTGEDGRAELEVTLPDNLTVWRAAAASVDRGTAGGLGESSVKVRKDVFVRIALPAYANTGDAFSAAALGRAVGDDAPRMRLTVRSEDPRTAVVEGAAEVDRTAPGGVAQLDVRVLATGAGTAVLEASAATDKGGDGLKRRLPVAPFGEPWRFVERRELRDRAAFAFEMPAPVVAGSVRAHVLVQAGLESELLEGLAFLRSFAHPSLDAVLQRTASAAVVHRACVDAGLRSPVDERELRAAVDRLWTTLRGYQNADGGFGPWPARPSEPEATAFALETLARLRVAGFEPQGDLWISTVTGASNALGRGGLTRDQRAVLAASLVGAGVDRGADLNALYRERDGLSTGPLAKLLRAACVAGRGALKADLLAALRARKREDAGKLPFAGLPRDPWFGDDQETTAHVLLAYQAADARVEEQRALVDALRARVATRGCVHVRAVAATAEALAKHLAGAGALDVAGDVVVTVDGKRLPAVRLDGKSPRAFVEIDAAALVAGRREVLVERTGGGVADVRLIVAAVKPAESVEAVEGFFEVTRRVVPYADPDAQEPKFAEGWSIVEETKRPPYAPPTPLAQAVAGTRATVRVAVRARDDAAFVVVEDPLPAGFEPVEAGVRGAFARFERRFDRMVFVFDRVKKGQELVATYPVYAALPGRFRAAPAEAYELYAPEARGRSGSYAFEVVEDAKLLARIAVPAPTPDARLAGARIAFAEGAYERVLELVDDLADAFVLEDAPHDETLTLVQRAALRLGRHARAVKARDALLARNPRAGALPVDDMERLGAALVAVGDPERAREQYLGVVEAGYVRERAAVDYLAQQGRGADAAAAAVVVQRRYPFAGAAAEADLADAGRYLELDDPRVRAESTRPLQKKRWADALTAYQRVMAWAPGTEAAESASLERLGVFVGLGVPAKAAEEARAFAARHADAPRLDEALAAEAEALFSLGRNADAKAPAERVRTSLFPTERRGPPVRRSARAEAMAYLLGKIAHVEGRLSDAVALYGEAASKVPDAAESHRFFTEKELATDPVVRVPAGVPATLPLRVKNVAKATLQVYPVDLGVLFATRKSFDALNQADLSGIAPAYASEFATESKPYLAARCAAPLGVGRTAGAASGPAAGLAVGAYLVVVSDGERSASSVVLAGDLELTAQRAEGGALRCYLVDGKGLPVAGARVTVGQDGKVRHAGETDERGMLLVSLTSGGKATIVAEADDRYAAIER